MLCPKCGDADNYVDHEGLVWCGNENCRHLLTEKHPAPTMVYDPPLGWKYGFPKPYQPKEGEALEDTLRRDGYPEELMHLAHKATRFWNWNPE